MSSQRLQPGVADRRLAERRHHVEAVAPPAHSAEIPVFTPAPVLVVVGADDTVPQAARARAFFRFRTVDTAGARMPAARKRTT